MKKHGNISKHLDLQSEKNKLQKNAFTVPEGYFDRARETILLHRKIRNLSENTFQVPPDYHRELSQKIINRVSQLPREVQLPTQDGLTVPKGYFSALSARILDRSEVKKKPVRTFRLKWVSYATAACLLLGVGIFSFLRYTDSSLTSENTGALIDEVATEEIIDYLAMYSEPGDIVYLSDQLPEESEDLTESFSSDAIEAYLEGEI